MGFRWEDGESRLPFGNLLCVAPCRFANATSIYPPAGSAPGQRTWPVLVTPPAAPHPSAERRAAPTLTTPATSSAGSPGHARGWPPVQARTHHCAERDGGVAVSLQVLLAEGLHHIGVRLQEELSELLANQVVAAVPQELASVVIGNQDLRVAGEEPASPAASLTPKNGEGGAGTSQGGPETQPLPSHHGQARSRWPSRPPASPQHGEESVRGPGRPRLRDTAVGLESVPAKAGVPHHPHPEAELGSAPRFLPVLSFRCALR